MTVHARISPRPELAPASRVFSYERFSTAEQSKGDSLRRQTEKAERYAVQHGLELDRSLNLQDLGVSAFRGGNFYKGALARFLKAIDDGIVPKGSWLLCENLDRLTRENPYDAQTLLREVFRRDISIITLDDQQIFNEEILRADIGANMLLTLTTFRAHKESSEKEKRLRAAWMNKRTKANKTILTTRGPAWLKVRRGKFVPIDQRAALIKRIFEMADAGIGLESIARAFNAEGIPPFGSAQFWQRSYIAKILDSPAVVGTFVPHETYHIRDPNIIGLVTKKRRSSGDVVENYFPKVIDEDLYERVKAMRQRRAPATRGNVIQNILASLAVCPTCHGTMTRVWKGRRSRPALVCSRAKVGAGCKYVAVSYDRVEAALQKAVKDGRLFRGKSESKLGDLHAQLEDIERQIGNVMSLILSSSKPSEALRDQLDTLEDVKGQIEREMDELVDPEVIDDQLRKLKDMAEWNATEVNAVLRQILSEVVVEPEGLKLKWKDGHVDILMLE